MSASGDIVKEYLSDERWQNLPSLTLAKKIYNEAPGAFRSVEHVRILVRYYRGASGTKNRKNLGVHDFINYNTYSLPQTEESEFFIYKLPSEANNILYLSDVHIPYHSISALNAAIEYGIKHNVNCILLNGDIWDCYQLSRFVKDPRKRSIQEERNDVISFINTLRNIFKTAFIFYKPGNHEERWEYYMKIKAPELLQMPEWELCNILRFNEHKIETITCPKQIIQAGALNIVHGHEFGKSVFNPVNPARKLFLSARASTIIGHYHQTSEHTESNINGKITTCWSTGCLCELHPEYMPINKWNRGFAHIEWDAHEYHVRNIRVIDGRII